MIRNHKGFTLVEALLVVLILAVLGFGGYYVWHSHHKTKAVAATNTSTTATKTVTKAANPYAGWQTYKSSDNVYSIKYPATWVTSNHCSDLVNIECLNLFPDQTSKTNFTNDVYVVEEKTSLSPKSWYDQNIAPASSDTITSNSTSINNYTTYYVKDVNPSYTDDGYIISNNGYLVYLNFREHETNYGPGGTTVTSQIDHSQYLPTYNKIDNSIRFNN